MKFAVHAGRAKVVSPDSTSMLDLERASGGRLPSDPNSCFARWSEVVALANTTKLLSPDFLQPVLAAMVLSMLAAPFIIQRSEAIVRRFSANEWMLRAMQIHNIAVQSMAVEEHVLICGYGRSGQNLARFLEQEKIPVIALDIDPERIREAAAAGEHVVFGDAARREVLTAAGLMRARALVITYADTPSALRILTHVHELRAGLPVVVRTYEDTDIDTLKAAGAEGIVEYPINKLVY